MSLFRWSCCCKNLRIWTLVRRLSRIHFQELLVGVLNNLLIGRLGHPSSFSFTQYKTSSGHYLKCSGVLPNPRRHRRRVPGAAHRQPLQQPQLRLRRLLPAQRTQAAAGQLQGRAPEPNRGHRGGKPHPQGLRGRRGAADGAGPRLRGQAEAGRGRVPPDHEVQLRQLPHELIQGIMKRVKAKRKLYEQYDGLII